jgi:hypothetical protein
VRLERGDAAAQRLPGDLDAVGRAEAGEPGNDEPAHGVRFEVLVVDLLREDPPVARVAHRVERREPGRAVVGLVETKGRLNRVTGPEYDVCPACSDGSGSCCNPTPMARSGWPCRSITSTTRRPG